MAYLANRIKIFLCNDVTIKCTIVFILGELGGYLGLLLGGSVITVCELMDLILYNAAIRCVKRNQVRDISKQPPSDLPVPGENSLYGEPSNTSLQAIKAPPELSRPDT